MGRRALVPVWALVFGLLVVAMQAVFDAVLFHADAAVRHPLLQPPDFELYLRTVMLALCVLTGVVVAVYLRRRAQVEEALRVSEQRYRALFDDACDAVIIYDDQGRITDANRSASELLGCPIEAIRELRIGDIGLPQGDPAHPGGADADGRQPAVNVQRLHRPDGTWVDVEVTSRRLPVAAELTQAVLRDVTAQQAGERALLASLEAERRLAEGLVAVTTAMLELSTCRSTDDLARSAVELGRQSLPLDRIGLWFTSDDGEFLIGTYGTDENGNTRDERHERHRLVPQENPHQMMSEQRRWRLVSDVDLYDHNHRVVGHGSSVRAALWDGERVTGMLCGDNLLSGRTITERDCELVALYAAIIGHLASRLKIDEERARLQAQVQDARKLESLRILAGGVAHDFNNILMAIIGNAELALSRMEPDSPLRHFVDEIEAAASRAAVLSRQMLTYSGHAALKVEPIDLSLLVQRMSLVLRSSVSSRAALHYELGGSPCAVLGDASQLEQVLVSLAVNASDALGDTPGIITIRTGVLEADEDDLAQAHAMDRHLRPGAYAFLEVSDTGCGMDPEVQSRIFEPFFSTKFAGRGLGLAAALGTVRAHHGAIQVTSEPGGGSTFRVLLPVADPAPRETAPTIRAEVGAHDVVLVADDDDDVLALTQRALESSGFHVITAENGHDAVELFRRNADRVSVVIMDTTMPRMGGREAIRHIRDVRDDVPLIVASGSMQPTEGDPVDDHIAAFLLKPYRPSEMVQRVREVIRARGEPRASTGAQEV